MSSPFYFAGEITASDLFLLFLHFKILPPAVIAIFDMTKNKFNCYVLLDLYVSAYLNEYLNGFIDSAASMYF